MVPEDQEVSFGWIVLECPIKEVGEDCGIAGVCFGKRADNIFFIAATLRNSEPVCGIVACPIELDDDVYFRC